MSELSVVDLWRFPVKSMLGERLNEASVGPAGITGDRAWSLVDRETGMHLTARRQPELLLASARLAGADPATATVDDGVIVTLPDGTETADDDDLSKWLGRDVALVAASSEFAATYETPIELDEAGDWVQWTGPAGSFHDSTRTMISLVTEATMGQWDLRRFRINVILDGSNEDDLVGRRLTAGSTTLDVLKQIDRCVMVTRPQADLNGQAALERDLDVLKTISRERDNKLGIGALVPGPGRIAIGDKIAVLDS